MDPVIDSVESALGVRSREDLTAFLVGLAQRARAGLTPVENETSPDMIEAAAYWIEGMEGFLNAHGENLHKLPPWSVVALIFSAGLVYE